jgi:ADP-heptose:LPS heptosyltransferase
VTRESIAALQEAVSGAGFDRAIVLTSFHQSPLPIALVLRLAGIPDITAASIDHAGRLLDVRLVPGTTLDEDLPEPERALAIAAAAGFPLPVDDDGRLAVTGIGPAFDELGLTAPVVVVHPGASAPARCWPPGTAAAAVRLLHHEGWSVVVTGGQSERALTAMVSHHGRYARDLGGRLPLPEFAALLARADVLVCGNTGPAHLAAAVGTPVVSLFSPVVPAVRWRPYRVPHVLLGDQLAPCRDSRARECPVPGHPCLASVTPAEVVAACAALVRTGAVQEALA